MLHRLIPGVIALLVVVVVIVVLNPFSGNVALAEVLKQMQTLSYRFTLSIEVEDANKVMQGYILQPGHMRLDDRVGFGEVSSLIDLESHQSLLLFHAYKTAQRVDLQQEFSNTGADQLLRLCAGPIDQLWRLQDGSEENLGTETLDGVKVRGFRVHQNDEYFDNEINIWADVKSGWAIRVEIHSHANKPPRESITWTLSQFDKASPLDTSLFDMNVPPGYTLAYQKSLSDQTFSENATPEALKIVEALDFWRKNRVDQAIERLLDVQWDQPIRFAEKPYVFTFTEKELVMLTQVDQKRIVASIMESCSRQRKLCFKLKELGEAFVSQKDYDQAEHYFESIEHLGKLHLDNTEGPLIAQLTGIAMAKIGLGALENLYQESGQSQKFIETRQRIQAVDAAHQKLKEKLPH